MKKTFLLVMGMLLIPKIVFAHCPLCTVGVGFLALGVAWLGVSSMSIGVFIGAFAIALGLWIGKILPQKISHQDWVLAFISFLTTIVPLMALLPTYSSMYISWSGEYGSILNRTYAVNSFFLGSMLGSILFLFAPRISKSISEIRKSQFSYQGIIITFILLFIVAFTIEIFL